MSLSNINHTQLVLLAINKKDKSKRVLSLRGKVVLFDEEELVVLMKGSRCFLQFQVERALIDTAASRFFEMNDDLCPWKSNFFETTWESSSKDVAAAVLKVEEGSEVFMTVRTREEIAHSLCFTVSRAS